MEALWWFLTLGLMVIGLVGTVAPLCPRNCPDSLRSGAQPLSLHSIGWPTLLALHAHDDGGTGPRHCEWFARRKVVRGYTVGGDWRAFLGAIVGLFFGLIGIFVGPLVGALLGELLGGKGLLPAGRSSWGTLIGTTAGIIGKFTIGAAMIIWFLIAAFV